MQGWYYEDSHAYEVYWWGGVELTWLCKDHVNMINDPTKWVVPKLKIRVEVLWCKGDRECFSRYAMNEWWKKTNDFGFMLFLVFGDCKKNKSRLTIETVIQGRGKYPESK